MKKFKSKFIAASMAAMCSFSAAALPLTTASAQNTLIGYKGDLNHDLTVSVADAVILSSYLNTTASISSDDTVYADLNSDSIVDIFDLIALRKCIAGKQEPIGIYEEVSIIEDFISAPIDAVKASLPSQGDAKLVIFYVDFPDCKYTVDFTADEIQNIAFGSADSSNSNYPFESMSAFYNRSSKGEMKLDGQVFRYTTKENQSAYNTDKVKLAEECYDAFKDSVDFSLYDGDNDGMIDATLFTVPTAAGDTDWWPCAGGFGDSSYSVDGKSIGHIITGNAQIESSTSYTNFVSSYLHEMGHCMGLPDYYLYTSTDYEGMHGEAGIELMDADASSDFSSFSKIMLGWYRKNQISVYDSSSGTQTFTLNNAQTDDGNCVIIPYGSLDSRYFSEYMVIEYSTNTANNSGLAWWQSSGSGIRIHHINAALQEDYWYTYLKYQNGSEYTNGDDDGIRLIRLVGDSSGGSFFKTGDIINSSTPGFGWYDSSEAESINPNVQISIGECTNDQYTITISKT